MLDDSPVFDKDDHVVVWVDEYGDYISGRVIGPIVTKKGIVMCEHGGRAYQAKMTSPDGDTVLVQACNHTLIRVH